MKGSSVACRPYVVLVDPFSTGAMLAPELDRRGYAVVALWTNEVDDNRHHIPHAAKGFPEKFLAEVDEKANLALTAEALRYATKADPFAVICGGETGVKVADALSEFLGLRGNGTAQNRRDRQLQQDAVKASGLRSVRSVCGKSWKDVCHFTETERFPIIVKPVESGGSGHGIKLCHSADEAEKHFQLLNSQRKVSGGAVLLQEYLKGKEYIVDCVSRDGVHKATMIWVFDRRPVASNDLVAQQVIAYTRGCLDALHITNGATYTEVMMTETGPRLVEVHSCCHGAAGAWMSLARSLTGYTQVDACVDAFLDANAFAGLPAVPPPFRSGQVATLVEGESTNFQRFRPLRPGGRRCARKSAKSLLEAALKNSRDPRAL